MASQSQMSSKSLQMRMASTYSVNSLSPFTAAKALSYVSSISSSSVTSYISLNLSVSILSFSGSYPWSSSSLSFMASSRTVRSISTIICSWGRRFHASIRFEIRLSAILRSCSVSVNRSCHSHSLLANFHTASPT